MLTFLAPKGAKNWFEPMYSWYLDTPGSFEDCRVGERGTNEGFMKRYQMVKGGRKVKNVFKIPCDLYQTAKLLPPGMNMRLKLTKARDAMVLMSQNDDSTKAYKVKVV